VKLTPSPEAPSSHTERRDLFLEYSSSEQLVRATDLPSPLDYSQARDSSQEMKRIWQILSPASSLQQDCSRPFLIVACRPWLSLGFCTSSFPLIRYSGVSPALSEVESGMCFRDVSASPSPPTVCIF